MKAIDIWLMTCFFLTFVVLLEFCLVLYMTNSAKWYEVVTKSKTKRKRGNRENSCPSKATGAYLMEKWSATVLPLSYHIFVLVFFFYFSVEQTLQVDQSAYKLREILQSM